ncbi:MAG TPA: MotA/TolQ/ExbB proton channel family protein [Candidatus Spyradenecus faecavium]|uniref:MotA/TolQ/ExbB proton channel family protein n=1 Tax=Candidatus Spyradenecus faecavium TaxID=2840947 RepID=A0A9D1NMS9_9BACT|nr:MotA/TolQ/ExbB proton channel family protein [Candidatus Spyradenecus faecavium]
MDAGLLAAMTTGPLRAFLDSDLCGQAIVVVQICMSVASWAVMSERILHLRELNWRASRFLGDFDRQSDPIALYCRGERLSDAPLENVYRATCDRFASLIPEAQRARLRVDPGAPIRLDAVRMELVESSCAHATDEETMKLGRGMTALAVFTSSAPLLGLFGTVWGVMLAFQTMAASGVADIAALAPGISSALLTTVVGLVVAIPSTIFYNVLQSKVEAQTVRLEGFAEDLMGKLSLHYRAAGTEG